MRLLVLGGGPAGLNAALQARELNAQVMLIEADRLGGTSLNRGPAPVRSLARAARLVRDTQSWPTFGLRDQARRSTWRPRSTTPAAWPTTPTTNNASVSTCAPLG
jgi:pyruvate/2-oxoglutarate dehydrogenase complex dihydrolipoamide dehydrogenase (E3) component